MAQGILQPDGSKCYSGVNCKRHGAGNRVALATKAFMSAAVIPENVKFPPVIVPETKLYQPSNHINLCYNGVSAQGDRVSSWDDANYMVWENLEIDEIDVSGVLSTLFGCPREDIPQDLFDLADAIPLSDPSIYDVYGENDYYGQNITAELSPSANNKLLEWYWTQSNAKDSNGVLAYCRSKGFSTTGLDPLEAIKGQLAQENPGRRNSKVDKATKVIKENLKLAQIAVPQKARLDSVTPTEAKPAVQNAASIIGVVYKDTNGYSLVDGYHRFKGASAGSERDGNFLVLS